MLASEWMGWENVFSVEIDEWCNKVSKKNFPNVKQYEDIKEFKGQPGSVDILTGGFPCQPFSHAGKRKGKSDDRYLWPEYLRVIREIKPSYVVGENVAGLVSMEDGKTLDGIFTDLEGEGYTIESFIIPACGVGAWHRRERIWIIAYHKCLGRAKGTGKGVQYKKQESKRQNAGNVRTKGSKFGINSDSSYSNPHSPGSYREEEYEQREAELRHEQERESGQVGENVSDTNSQRLQGREGNRMESEKQQTASWSRDSLYRGDWWESEPNVGRVANGILRRVDRLKGLGNAIVPQVAFELFRAIEILN